MSGPNTNFDPKEVAALAPEAIAAAVTAARSAFAAAASLDDLKSARTAHMGNTSPLALANREIGALPPAAKAEAGKRVGMARGEVKAAYEAAEADLHRAAAAHMLDAEREDVTAVPHRLVLGSRHPVVRTVEFVADIFAAMGWDVVDGPEVEAEWLNFDALNHAPDHPARGLSDTFHLEPEGSGLVLRTHTSPVQARALLERGAPLYIASPGKTFRTDELDATHLPVFHQVEGLAVDRHLTMAHLRGTLDHLAQSMFGEGITTRLRPHFFPFTEPSAEMDLRCFVCAGKHGTVDPDCRSCGGTGWIEWGGCGMVHPNVLRACGVDPEEFRGFAFGMGIERALMFRTGAADMRDMIEGDIRFNTQFSVEM